jgi:hypothetical protein
MPRRLSPITTTPVVAKKSEARVDVPSEREPKESPVRTGRVPRAKAVIMSAPCANEPLDKGNDLHGLRKATREKEGSHAEKKARQGSGFGLYSSSDERAMVKTSQEARS